MFNITRRFYTVQTAGEGEVEIKMYGDIVESRPRNYYTGEPEEGSFIVQDEFLNDLETVVASGVKTITLRINSLGGDAGVSVTIHNRLRELAGNGITVQCIVDGVAMSGGSLIMCACDPVKVYPSSMVMVHKARALLIGMYNSDELREEARKDDAWDEAQVSIYNRKCKQSDTVISHMMSATTYLIGRDIIEKGFADELLDGDGSVTVAASADRHRLIVGGRSIPLMSGEKLPEEIHTVTTANADVINQGTEGGETMPKNLNAPQEPTEGEAANAADTTQATEPTANGTASVDAVTAERRRIEEIDAIANLFDADTVREAKYGEHPCSAQEMAYRAATKAAAKGEAFMKNVNADYTASGAGNVSAAENPQANESAKAGEETPEAIRANAKAAVKAYMDAKGVKA